MTARRPRAHALSERIGSLSALDGPAAAISKQVRGAIGPGPVKDALSGTWLGHALHPLLTDIPIGTWVSSLLLDAFGGRESRDASRRLIGAGIIASVPTAITGMTEYADSEPGHDAVRRIGALHAVANVAALSLYGASFAARRRGAHATGVMFGAAASRCSARDRAPSRNGCSSSAATSRHDPARTSPSSGRSPSSAAGRSRS